MIKYVKLTNWKGLTGAWPLGQRTYLTGPNGSGKSALIQALQWALTGEVPGLGKTPAALAALVGPEGPGATVEVQLMTPGGETWRVTRQMVVNGGSTRSQVRIDVGNGDVVTGAPAKGLSEVTLRPVMWLLNQGALLAMTPAERRKALLAMVPGDAQGGDVGSRLDYLEGETASLQDKIKTLRKQVKTLKAQADAAGQGLMPLEVVQAEIQTWTRKRDEARDALRDLTADAEGAKRKREKIQEELNRWDALLTKVTGKLEGFPLDMPSHEDLEGRRVAIGPEPAPPPVPSDKLDRQIKTKLDKLGYLKGFLDGKVTCPLDKGPCPRDWSKSKIPQKVTELEAQIAELIQQKETAKLVEESLQQWKESLVQVTKAETLLSEYERLLDERANIEATMTRLEKELADLPPEDVSDIQFEVDTLQEALKKAQTELDRLSGSIDRWTVVKVYQDQLEEAQTELDRAKSRLKQIQQMQAELIENSLFPVLGEATDILNKIGGKGEILARVEKNSIRLFLEVSRFEGVSPDMIALETLSQGEQIRVWIALAYAFLSRHTGLKLLVVEGAEVDLHNIRKLLDGLSQLDPRVGVQVVFATWIGVKDTPQDWNVVVF